jgi:hypothetical protein
MASAQAQSEPMERASLSAQVTVGVSHFLPRRRGVLLGGLPNGRSTVCDGFGLSVRGLFSSEDAGAAHITNADVAIRWMMILRMFQHSIRCLWCLTVAEGGAASVDQLTRARATRKRSCLPEIQKATARKRINRAQLRPRAGGPKATRRTKARGHASPDESAADREGSERHEQTWWRHLVRDAIQCGPMAQRLQ